MGVTKSQRAKIEVALSQHEKLKNAYFWTPPTHAAGRRKTEARESFTVSFKHAGKFYSYESAVSCSCRNFYYRGTFLVDGEKKTVRAFKNLL